jgi:hypothetical protein
MIKNCINQIIVVKNIRDILNLEIYDIYRTNVPQVLFVSYLDLHLEIDIFGHLSMNFYEKRDALLLRTYICSIYVVNFQVQYISYIFYDYNLIYAFFYHFIQWKPSFRMYIIFLRSGWLHFRKQYEVDISWILRDIKLVIQMKCTLELWCKSFAFKNKILYLNKPVYILIYT